MKSKDKKGARFFRFLLPLPALLFCAGCAAIFFARKPAQPISMTQGAILLSLRMKGHDFPYFLGHYAHRVSFAQIGPDGQPDMDHLFYSNYYSGHYVYALNMPQGRYIPVAASYPFLGAQDAIIFNPDDIKDWVAQVKPGQIVFMGEDMIYLDWDNGVELSTRTLTHLAGLIPFQAQPVVVLDSKLPQQDISPAAAAEAFRHACVDLDGTLWLPAAEQELVDTGNPPPPFWKDFFHRHQAMPVGAKTFSYFDILDGWRGPFPIAGGLAWQKNSKVAITVAYVSPNDLGYKPVPEYLDDMRGAGVPGDDHLVSQIRFSGKTAYSVLYTSYDYPQANLVGSQSKVYQTRTIIVPTGKGYYLIHYRALKDSFDKYYPLFSRFAWYLILSPPALPAAPESEQSFP